MNRGGIAWLVALYWLAAAPAIAADSTPFADRVQALYSFSPKSLTEDQIVAKSAELDKFWDEVKAAPDGLALLRTQLADGRHSTFFSYDGAKLLLAMSKERSDLSLALRSIAKADLREIQGEDYVRTVQSLAIAGVDTREAAFRVLDYPDFFAFIPQHALTLKQDIALIYMLFPMDETVFVDDLARKLRPALDLTAQKSLMQALWYTCTPVGRATLKATAVNPAYIEPARAWARELLERKAGTLQGFSLSGEATLRKKRRAVMSRRISDEALMDFDAITAKLLNAR